MIRVRSQVRSAPAFGNLVRWFCAAIVAAGASADSVNSPNITLGVDTNRASGPGAVGVFVVVNTITVAETMLPEYSSGAGREIRLVARPGFQFDATSPITCQSATVGINGLGLNAVASVTPTGAADEAIVFSLTSGAPTNVQDILRINGVRVRILSAAGAVGPAQTTIALTTSAAGGAFNQQGIVAANITRGLPDRLEFAVQPGTTETGADLLPAIRMVDFGGNVIPNDTRDIFLTLQANPGGATLLGTTSLETENGVATWRDAQDLRIIPAAAGYTLRANHNGGVFRTSDTVDSAPFEITAGPPNRMEISLQPANTPAGEPILIAVSVRDAANNLVTNAAVDVTLDAAVNPGGWPLLADSSVTKTTVNGVATWEAADNLRINRAVAGYRLIASGVGSPQITDAFDITPATPAALRFVQQPSEVQQGAAISDAVSVEIVDEFNNRTTATSEVSLVLDSVCGGTLSGRTVNAVNGLATFSALSLDTPCTGVRLEAVSGALVRTTSDTFSVTPLPGTALRFVQQPTAVVAGEAFEPSISVEILNATGARSTSDAQVQLALVSACGGALSTTSAVAVNGLATFGAVSIDTACENVTLQATSDGLTAATSNAFEVSEADQGGAAPLCGGCAPVNLVTMLPLAGALWSMRRRK
ncbi:MAG: hypothetical protein SF069_15480 [Phycisphaerae bacterium]|nr:hypothetical protein [Phycisphaerae bacterium]